MPVCHPPVAMRPLDLAANHWLQVARSRRETPLRDTKLQLEAEV